MHGNRYGTSQKWIGEARAKGLDIMLEIDWQGARQVRRAFPDAVGIFVLPPPPVLPELERRLHGRGQDTERMSCGSSAIAALTSEDLPAPEGAETMKRLPFIRCSVSARASARSAA